MSGARRLMHRILDHPALANGLLIGVYLAAAATGIFGVWWPLGAQTLLTDEGPATGYSRLSCSTERLLTAGDVIDFQIYCGAASTIRGSVLCEVWARRSG